MNPAVQLVGSQSHRLLDSPFVLAQALTVTSYAVALGGAFLDNARLFEQVSHLAVSDPLTGLANYRRLLDVLETETERTNRNGRPFAVLLLDLDGLKKINDTHGHLVGSHALNRLGHILRIHCRAIDTAARYGGDEFALVLPETSREEAERVANRIRAVMASDPEQPQISASIGIAIYNGHGERIEKLLSNADAQLYFQKPRPSVHSPPRQSAPDCRPGLDPVLRPAAHEPNVLHLRMPVDQKLSVPSIFVLAYARLHNRRPAQPRKPLLHKTPRFFRAFRTRQTRLRVRINALAVPVHRDLQPPAFQIRHPVNLILLKQPRRQRLPRKSRIPRAHAQEKHFLPARENPSPQNLRKKFPQPCPAGKHKRVRLDALAGIRPDGRNPLPPSRLCNLPHPIPHAKPLR